MKIKYIVLLFSFSITIISCGTIFGNKNIITDERNLSFFDKIEISGSAEVIFHSSAEYRAVVTVDSNLSEYLETTVRNGVLIIRERPGYDCVFTKETVDVYCPNITDISLSGSGRFDTIDKIRASKISINVSGSGKISGNVECNNILIDISGSGSINIAGKTENADVKISGSGNLKGTEFSITNCSVNLSGSGKADIFVNENLDVRISGSGNITYSGNPQTNINSSGSGKVTKRNPV